MKSKIPHLDELVNRLAKQIENRHEGKTIGESEKLFLAEKWKGKEADLLRKVKKMEQEFISYQNSLKRHETRTVTFQTGVDVLGFPTFTSHLLRFENKFKDPKRYKKQGSDFSSRCIQSAQVDFIQNGFKTRVIQH